jgi:transposase
MKLEQLFTEALGIKKPWKIVSLNFDSVARKLNIDVDFERGATFEYEDPQTGITGSYKAYDTIDKTWRHLNFFEHECYINARTPRIKPPSGGVKLIMPPWSGVVKGFTLLFEALCLQLCQSMPISQVGKILRVSDHRLWHLLECYVFKAMHDADYSAINAVGMDETSLKKGHNYITLFVDMNEKKTTFISEGKDNKTVKSFAENLEENKGFRANIKDVSCDMSPAFIKGVKEQLPEAKITFDKFHILKIINEAVDKVRRAETKDNPILKGSRYVLLKNAQNLTTKQKNKRESLSNLNLKSVKALRIREAFQAIYKTETKESFERLLKEWYFWATHCKIPQMVQVAKTIKNHWDGILAWKRSQITNGILEGLNSIIQAAKRKARGYKFEHFKVIAYLLTGKLDLRKVNPFLPT